VARSGRVAVESVEQAKVEAGDLAAAVADGWVPGAGARVYELATARGLGQAIPLFD
jgi:hypothetical protein